MSYKITPYLLSLAFSFSVTAANADVSGLAVGVQGATLSTHMDRVHNGYTGSLNQHPKAYGAHARFLVQDYSGWTSGVEVRYQEYNGSVLNAGKGKETFVNSWDVFGVLGFQEGKLFPHALAGITVLKTSKSVNDCMSYGVGLTYEISDHLDTTFRAVKKECDGPYQGGDLDVIDLSLALSWRF